MMTVKQALDLAIQHHRAGQLAAAESIYRQILAAEPTHPDVPLNLGGLLHDQARYDQALTVYQQAIAINPNSAQTWCNISNTLCEMGLTEPSIAAAQRALQLDQNSFGALNNLGNALKNHGQLPESADAYRRALAIRPDFAFAHNNLGNVLHRQGDLHGAIACFKHALKLTPDYPEALSNLGNAIADIGRWDEGLALCRRSMALRPDYPSVHWNIALMLLRQGDFSRGWPEYEWRWKVKNLIVPPMKYTHPWWDGSDLNGKRILIHAEQGLGDTLQFVRYVPLVAARGGKVILHFHDDLFPLLHNFPGAESAIPWSQPLPDFDLHCPLLSLPRIFQTTLATIPAAVPYISPRRDLCELWKTRLPQDSRQKIGLVWAGRPTHFADRRRSIPLSHLAPLATTPNAWFCSLQVGPAAHEARTPPPNLPLADFSSHLTDFAQTAALIANLDRVIAVDTAVAHLAAAMGKPVWVLLPFAPDWRWMLNRSDSPWYPTMKLFRQRSLDDWNKPITEMAEALQKP